jgi:uncharacterized protein YjdB
MKRFLKYIPFLLLVAACVGDHISVTDRYISYLDPELEYSATSAEAIIGAENRLPFLINDLEVAVTYSSSDESVATVNKAGKVTIVGVGTTTITASFDAFENYLASSASYILKVIRAGSAISWSETSFKATIDEENVFPTLDNPDSQQVTYSSDNEAVASIDSESGKITLNAGGSAIITATAAENAYFSAGRASYNLTVAKAAVAISWSEESATVSIFGPNVFPELDNPASQDITYSSSDESVATIDAATGEIALVSGGSTVISASAVENDRYEASSAAFTLTVTKAEAGIEWSQNECTVVFGSTASFPVLVNPNGLDITYSSSNPSVATISTNGKVSVLAGGTTVITASFAETGQWEAASTSYTLNVEKAEAGIAWSASTWSATIDETTTFPTLSNPNTMKVAYSSSDESVATINSSARVTLVGPGTTTIIASTEETATHKASSVYYDLRVIKREIIKENADLAWSASEATLSMLGKGKLPTLDNPHGLTITYNSNHTDIASIDAEGKITPVAAGSATITASSKETETFLAGSASFMLTVTRVDPALKWSSNSSTATLGGNNSFPRLTNTYKVAVSYRSSDESVARISASGQMTLVGTGSAIITATSEESTVYLASSSSYDLTVKRAKPTLTWSASAGTACLDGTSSLPTLNNPQNLEITFSSGNESVATVSSTGKITAISAGSTTITATSKATDYYSSISASYTLTVTKRPVSLSFSSNTASVILGESGNYPTLTITPSNAGLNVTYTSSNSSVATVNQSTGQVTPKVAGTTVITASYAGNNTYEAAYDSYTLTVLDPSSISDDDLVFPSSGDSSSEDDISNTTFTRLVTVIYSSGSANVTGTNSDFNVTISGGQVTIRYNGSEFVAYKLTGSTSNGFFKLYSSKKQAIWLSGVSITNSSGAAINNQSGKRTFVYVDGSNSLGDGSSASYSSGSEDMKGVLFSEGQLLFSGNGSLTVNANNSKSKNGIVSDDYVRFMSSPSITVNCGQSAGNGVKVNDYVKINSGTLNISTKAAMRKGITSDNYVLVEGGTTTITVSGGVAYDSEDGEYKGSAGIKADNYFGMKGGRLTITNSGAGGKGINAGDYDFNSSHTLSDSYISGGTLTVKTTGSESNDVSAKGIKIGWATKSGSGMSEIITGYAGNLKISNGNVSVTSSGAEALEVKANLTISGGRVYAYSGKEDAINSSNDMTISGGYVCAWSQSTGRGDAFDANGNMYITGGLAYGVATKELAFDANSEASKKLYVRGGTLIAVGNLEHGNSITGTAYTASSMSANTWYGLWDSNGKAVFAFKTPSVSGRSLIVYSGGNSVTLKSGVSTTSGTSIFSGNGFIPGTISGGNVVSLSSYVDSGGGPGGGGGGW